jgi:hypothetical protein
MRFLVNLNEGLAQILPRLPKTDLGATKLQFEVRVNNWDHPDGNRELPTYLGICKVPPKFLRDFRALCEKHKLK